MKRETLEIIASYLPRLFAVPRCSHQQTKQLHKRMEPALLVSQTSLCPAPNSPVFVGLWTLSLFTISFLTNTVLQLRSGLDRYNSWCDLHRPVVLHCLWSGLLSNFGIGPTKTCGLKQGLTGQYTGACGGMSPSSWVGWYLTPALNRTNPLLCFNASKVSVWHICTQLLVLLWYAVSAGCQKVKRNDKVTQINKFSCNFTIIGK